MAELYYNFNNDRNKTITLILGIEKPILRDFRFTNIQMVVGNDFEYFPEKLDFLVDAIVKNRIFLINIIGLSKTCTAGIVYASKLAEKFIEIPIKLFLFSPYTTIKEQFFYENKLLDRVPRSLKILWEKKSLSEEFFNFRDVTNLVLFKNVQTFVIYPQHGVHSEPECALRIAGQDKVTLIPLCVNSHAVLLPFWNKLKWNFKIEAFENEYSYLSIEDYWYYIFFQKEFKVKESLYELIFDHTNFIKELDIFNEKMRERKIPFLFTLIFTCINWQLKAGKFISRNMRKMNKNISLFSSKVLNNLKQKS